MICRHLGSAKQVLIVPLTFFSGLEQGFFGADFTAVLFPPHHSHHTSYSFHVLRQELKLKFFWTASHSRALSLVPMEFTLLVASSSFMALSTLLPPLLRDSFAGNKNTAKAFVYSLLENWWIEIKLCCWRKVGRLPIFLLAAATNLAVIVAMLVYCRCNYESTFEREVLSGEDLVLLFPVRGLHPSWTLGLGWCNLADTGHTPPI